MTQEFLLAAKYGRTEELKRHLDAGQDPNEPTHDGYTALIVAARDGTIDSVQMLIELRAITTGEWGWKALYRAAENGHDDVVELLLANGGDAVRLLAKGITSCRRPAIRRYGLAQIERGSDFDPEQLTSALNNALHWDDYDLAAALLGSGADPDRRDELGYAPLDLSGEPPLVQLLTAAGVNPTRCSGCGFLLGPVGCDCPVCAGIGLETLLHELLSAQRDILQTIEVSGLEEFSPSKSPSIDGKHVIVELSEIEPFFRQVESTFERIWKEDSSFDNLLTAFDRLKLPPSYSVKCIPQRRGRGIPVALPIDVDVYTADIDVSPERAFDMLDVEDSYFGYLQYAVFRAYTDLNRPNFVWSKGQSERRDALTWTEQMDTNLTDWPEYIYGHIRAEASSGKVRFVRPLTEEDRRRIHELIETLPHRMRIVERAQTPEQLERLMYRGTRVREQIKSLIPREVKAYSRRSLVNVLDLRPRVTVSP